MPIHTHTIRDCCAMALVLVPAPFLLSWPSAPNPKNHGLAQVSGQVTCVDRPFSGAIYFLPADKGRTYAMGAVKPDGSFQLYVNGQVDQCGAVPGTYRVIVRPRMRDKMALRVDSKYEDPATTDLLVHIEPDWNYVRFNLH